MGESTFFGGSSFFGVTVASSFFFGVIMASSSFLGDSLTAFFVDVSLVLLSSYLASSFFYVDVDADSDTAPPSILALLLD